MGGVKRKPISQMELEKKEGEVPQQKKKGKQPVEKRVRGLTLPTLSDEAFRRELEKMGAITPYTVASKYDIRLGIAKSLLRDMERKGVVSSVGGCGRVRIYKAAGS